MLFSFLEAIMMRLVDKLIIFFIPKGERGRGNWLDVQGEWTGWGGQRGKSGKETIG